jgi:hypothetical protein
MMFPRKEVEDMLPSVFVYASIGNDKVTVNSFMPLGNDEVTVNMFTPRGPHVDANTKNPSFFSQFSLKNFPLHNRSNTSKKLATQIL